MHWFNEYLIVRKTDNEPTTSRCGQKPVKFDDDSTKTKKWSVSGLLKSHSSNELPFAASEKLRDKFNVIAAKKVSNISNTDKASKYSADEALALIIDACLTKSSYPLIRSGVLEKENKLYPTYNDVRDTNLKCYPAIITWRTIQLQDLIIYTLQRVCISRTCAEALDYERQSNNYNDSHV